MLNKKAIGLTLVNNSRTSLAAIAAALVLTGACGYWADSVQDAMTSATIRQTACQGREPSQAYLVIERKKSLTNHLAQKYGLDERYVRHLVELAWRESERHDDVSVELILAVMQKESGLRANAVSHRGARGVMQVLPRFHPDKIRPGESLQDPSVNIRVGTTILQEYLEAHDGDPHRALRKYSGGANGYSRAILREVEELKSI